MKKAIIVGLALIPILLFITSCGVAQEEYDRVSSDLTAAQAQVQSLQSDLSTKESELVTAQTEIQSLQGELSTTEAELSAKESNLAAAQSQIQSLQGEKAAAKAKLDEGKARIEIVNALFIPAITGELDRMTEAESVKYFFEWRDKVVAVGDPALTAKFNVMLETFSDEALTSFFIYLLESIPKALE